VTDQAIALLAPRIGTRAACAASGVAQASWYRRHRASAAPPCRPPVPHRDRRQPRALARGERLAILAMLHSDRFADLAPAETWAILLDEGTYLGSVSTFYRLLRAAGESRERRTQAVHPAAVKPELAAAAPNQVWSWDTKLHGPARRRLACIVLTPLRSQGTEDARRDRPRAPACARLRRGARRCATSRLPALANPGAVGRSRPEPAARNAGARQETQRPRPAALPRQECQRCRGACCRPRRERSA
jgi:hypothetical protein